MTRTVILNLVALIIFCSAAQGAEDGKGKVVSVSGKIVGPDGKPVVGAAVYIRSWSSLVNELPKEKIPNDILAQTRANEKGEFGFKDVVLPAFQTGDMRRNQWYSAPWDVIVVAKGYAIAWQQLTDAKQKTPVHFTLSPEANITGRLTDKEGKPAAGVSVRLISIQALDQPRFSAEGTPGHLDLSKSQMPVRAKTETNGAFVLAGLPQNVRTTLTIEDDRFIKESVYVATTEKPQPTLKEQYGGETYPAKIMVHNASFNLRLHPGRAVKGRILLEDNGAAAKQVHLSLRRTDIPPKASDDRFTGVSFEGATDGDGNFAIRQLPPGKYALTVQPLRKSDYLGVSTTLQIAEGQTEAEQNLKLPKGIVVTGQIVDEETGRGVGEVVLSYQPAAAVGFDLVKSALTRSRHFSTGTTTAADGSFRLAVPLGKGKITVASVPPTHLQPQRYGGQPTKFPSKDIDAKPGTPLAGLKLAISSGVTVTGRVVDAAGKPVQGAAVDRSVWSPTIMPVASTDAEGKFTVGGLDPGHSHDLVVTHAGRKLGGKATVSIAKGKKTASVEVKLQPTGSAKGRILNEAKQPLANTPVQIQRGVSSPGGGTMIVPQGSPISADKDGQFTIDLLVPGVQYWIQITPKDYASGYVSSLEIKPDAVHQCGDLICPKANEVVAGVVVDPSGKPVAGVQVQGSPESRSASNFSPSAHGFTLTGKDGKFRFDKMIKGKTRIFAYTMPTGTNRSISNYRQLVVESGKQDVRLVMVPPPEQRAAEATTGKPAPEFAVTRWLNRDSTPPGRGFARDDFKGKIILLAFVDEAKPSLRLMPKLEAVHKNLADKGVIVVRVCETKSGDELAKVSPTPAALVDPGLLAGNYSEAFQKYGVTATPTLFLIDRQGTLRFADVSAEDIEQRVAELLK